MKEYIENDGNRAVVIHQDGSSVRARLFVNARNGIAHATGTTVCWKGRTLAGARRWSALQLSRGSAA